ncbi:MAG: PSD1 and planctomycete cytochrome C domain-containing protein [Flavobacteriaceae bacterium]|nr:PSD1 and planctomycete cytochrome C domain-containing protein [Flavobacteriaceae bacterium]MDG1965664.1 PSD1 and planctomycete cytochrome C domain-containing protein [Flavobacteriaceae bacterium]
MKKFTPVLYFLVAFGLTLFTRGIFNQKPKTEINVLSSSELEALEDTSIPELISYNFDVKPILSDKCYKCHGPDPKAIQGDFRIDVSDHWYRVSEENPEKQIIYPSQITKSELVDRIRSTRASHQMPPPESNLVLTEKEKQIIERWIEQGAAWETHWAYIPPEKNTPPENDFDDWNSNEIDHFVGDQMKNKGMKPAPKAPKEFLLRRLYFDLIGLPPTLNEIDDFLKDESNNAYEKVVDRLLQSSSYGERMASVWMDIARYADTNGYQDDTERFMWPWRDWVIHAYNQNMPYDQFVTWQLAGDLLPETNKEQILATGFNRNHMITQEGGVIEEEYRVEYVADRTVTAAKSFMGLTMECARCHDHKYDELTQKDFFNLYSFFNRLEEKGRIGYQEVAGPKIKLNQEVVNNELHFVQWPDSIPDVEVMVMDEVENLRTTYILNRGAYDAPTDAKAEGGMPDTILSFDPSFPKNRLGLTQWFFDPNNPLTARVAVNNLWQQLFGMGIVATPSDFGNQGALPTHPQLLDWLAVTFMEEDWDIKKMVKRMVMSSTYQQSSKPNALQLRTDPKNQYLSVYPRQKLTAEMIRDNVLVSSGLFVDKIGGPSVKPYQPPGLWDDLTGGSTSNSLKRYIMSSDGNQYRRSLYTYWKRTAPPPGMITFDASTRDYCTVERQKTSTPLQSLILLNDPQVQNAAEAIASLILKSDIKKSKDRIIEIHRRITGRKPTKKALSEMIDYLNSVGPLHEENIEEISETILEHKRYTSLALLIYNLDETSQKS